MAKEKDSSNLKIRPLDDRVVVEPLEAEEKTAGGILLAGHRQAEAAARPRPGGRPRQAQRQGRAHRAVAVAKGDEVIYGRYSGNDIEVDGREVKIMRESDILAKVVK